ncbi:uncharacterized protein [Medicago truncatula]|nr:uncharacterized protein LOC25487975 [Medicago truncatula]
MAVNSNADLFDHHENEVLGFNSIIRSNVNVGLSCSEILICDVGRTSCSRMFDVYDGGCGGKVGKFSCGLMKIEDEKSVIEQACQNVGKVALSNEVQGVEDDVTEHKHENDVALANFSAVVEDDGVLKAADSFVVTKDDSEDSRVSDVATYRLQDGIRYAEGIDVKAEESLKQSSFLSDAQLNVIQDQTTNISISGAGIPNNIQYDCRGFDLNSNKNTQEDRVPRESMFSDVNYRVSDLVWGKVRGHSWWPGQIYVPSVASVKAKRHCKGNCYLIAYFGDQTFAWNDVSMIKPFHKHFSQMEKQSDLKHFRHAVDCALEEASRHVEFGLSCPCMPGQALPKLNANDATSFEPTELVNFVKSLAQS